MHEHLAIGYWYREHSHWLQQWFRRRLSCTDQARDFVNETFLKLLLADDLNHIQSPRAFLTVVARQLLVDQYRRQSLEQAYLSQLSAEPMALQPSEEDRAIVLDLLRAVDRLLNGLSEVVRTTFLLSQLQGLGYAAIASQLGVSERTVKRHMAQAFEACLRAKFEHYGNA